MSLSIQKSALESQVLNLVEKVGFPLGFRAVDVDCRLSHRSLIRIFIERQVEEGQRASHAASIDDCAVLSRALDDALEATELFPGPFDLEVSSPGLERRLRLESDFQSELGKEIRLKLTENLEGRGANLSAVLESVEEGVLTVLQDKKVRKIPIDKIKQANLIWRGPDKGLPGQKKHGAKS